MFEPFPTSIADAKQSCDVSYFDIVNYTLAVFNCVLYLAYQEFHLQMFGAEKTVCVSRTCSITSTVVKQK